MDGSTEWHSFWRITLPLLRPILALVLVITVTGSFQVFDTVAVTTKGGPVNATRVMQYYIYQKGFAEGQFGYACALSVILFIILVSVALIQLKLLNADRVGSGLRGLNHVDHHYSSEIRARPTPTHSRRQAGQEKGQPRPHRGVDPAWSSRSSSRCSRSTGCCGQRFSTSKSLFSNPGSLLPVDPTLGAFKRVLGLASVEEAQAEGGSGASVNFLLYLRNSIVYSTLVTVGQVFFCALAAYAFARLNWPGRDKVFVLFLAALMVPPIFTLAAELHPDQEPRSAEHLRRGWCCRPC